MRGYPEFVWKWLTVLRGLMRVKCSGYSCVVHIPTLEGECDYGNCYTGYYRFELRDDSGVYPISKEEFEAFEGEDLI